MEFFFTYLRNNFLKINLFLLLLVCLSAFLHELNGSTLNIFIFEAGKFSDLSVAIDFTRNSIPYSGTWPSANYPPFAFFLLSFFGDIDPEVAVFLFIFLSLFLTFLGTLLVSKDLKNNNQSYLILTLCIVFSHPFLFAIFRGNLDLFVGFLMIFFFYGLNRKNLLAGVAIGLAGAIKISPLAFILIFVFKKDIKNIAISLSIFILSNLLVINYWNLDFFKFMDLFLNELKIYQELYVLGGAGMSFFSDPWLLINGFVRFIDENLWDIYGSDFLIFYNFFQIFICSVFTILIFLKKISIRTSTMLIIISFMLMGFPFPTNDYKLLYLLPGFLVIMTSSSYEKNIYLITLRILLLITFLHLSFFSVYLNFVNISSILRPMIYLAGMTTIGLYLIQLFFHPKENQFKIK